MIYFSLLFALAIFSSLSVCKQSTVSAKKNIPFQNIVFVFTGLAMFLIAAFRYKTGRDWGEYMKFFDGSLDNDFNLEKGFILVNRFFKYFFDSFFFMQVACTAFACYFMYKGLYEYTLLPVVTLFFYFTTYYFSTELAQTRQFIAMAILIQGKSFIDKKQILKWSFLVFIAMQFHVSAILAFPLYFTTRLIVSPGFAFFFLVACIFLELFGLSLIRKLLETISYLPFLPRRLSSLVLIYLNSSVSGKQTLYGTGLGALVKFLFYILIIILYKTVDKNGRNKSYLFNFLIGVLLNAFGRNFDQFGRVGNYYFICGYGLSSFGLFFYKNRFFKKMKYMRFCVSLLVVAFYLLTFIKEWYSSTPPLTSRNDDWLPYKTFIGKEL